MKLLAPLTYCSMSCVCERCLNEDERLPLITANNFRADVRFRR